MVSGGFRMLRRGCWRALSRDYGRSFRLNVASNSQALTCFHGGTNVSARSPCVTTPFQPSNGDYIDLSKHLCHGIEIGSPRRRRSVTFKKRVLASRTDRVHQRLRLLANTISTQTICSIERKTWRRGSFCAFELPPAALRVCLSHPLLDPNITARHRSSRGLAVCSAYSDL